MRYKKGEGVPQDVVKAYMWYTLSTAQGDEAAAKNREHIAAKMTPAQIAAAERLVRVQKAKKRK